MKSGVLVLGIFGFLWAGAALLGMGAPAWQFAIPLAVSAGLVVWAFRSRAPVRTPEEQRRIRRAVALWSTIEGLAILVAVNVLRNVGAPDALAAAIAIIVGLHFLALARAFPQPLYHATGAALILAGGVGLLLDPQRRLAAIGAMAALVLWSSAAFIILRSRRSAA